MSIEDTVLKAGISEHNHKSAVSPEPNSIGFIRNWALNLLGASQAGRELFESFYNNDLNQQQRDFAPHLAQALDTAADYVRSISTVEKALNHDFDTKPWSVGEHASVVTETRMTVEYARVQMIMLDLVWDLIPQKLKTTPEAKSLAWFRSATTNLWTHTDQLLTMVSDLGEPWVVSDDDDTTEIPPDPNDGKDEIDPGDGSTNPPPVPEDPDEELPEVPEVTDPPGLVVKGTHVFKNGTRVQTLNTVGALGWAIANVPPRNDGKYSVVAIDGSCTASSIKKGNKVDVVPLDSTAKIDRHPWGGADTIAIFPDVNYVRFHNIGLELSARAMVLTVERGRNDPPNRGLGFYDCYSLKPYDHITGTGPLSKWVFLLNFVADFTVKGGEYHGVEKEHFYYVHQILGDILIQDVTAYRIGRTFFQGVNRPRESGHMNLPVGTGTVRLLDNVIADTGCSLLDGGHGGSTITLAGRHRGEFIARRNTVSLGYDALLAPDGTVLKSWPGLYNKLLPLSKPGQSPYNACVMLWQEAFDRDSSQRPIVSELSNLHASIEDNVLRQNPNAPGDSQRPRGAGIDACLVADGTETVEVRRNRFTPGARKMMMQFNRPGRPKIQTLIEEENVRV